MYHARMRKSRTRKSTPVKVVKKTPPKLPLPPEIAVFVARADAVRKRANISRATLSKRLFENRAGVIDNLADGYGCNITNWIEAQQKLAALEAELHAESAA